jgi:hypothetical protein
MVLPRDMRIDVGETQIQEKIMEEFPEIEFKVGESYTNEKGVFEVISIKGDRMVMAFENGEEVSSNISLQRHIQSRRQWEKAMSEKEAVSSSPLPRRKPRHKSEKPFNGLQPDVFQNKISDTKWRSRQQLGGSVAAQLSFDRFNFNSWAAASRNEIHWADTTHWKSKKIPHAAKFFARADETSFSWGFYIERPDATGSESADWEAFIQWLRHPENDQWLREAALKEGLEVYDAHKSCFTGLIRPREADWGVEGSSVRKSTDTLGACIDSWMATAWLDLMIAKRIPMAEAIGRSENIVGDIAALFGHLLPLYEAAVSHLK